MRWFAGTWARLGHLLQTLVILRAPLMAALIGVGVMSTSQLQEVVTVFMDDRLPLTEINHFTFALVGVVLASVVIWFVGRSSSLNAPLERPSLPLPSSQSAFANVMRSIRAAEVAETQSRAFFLAVAPVAIATGYLTYGYLAIYRHLPADSPTSTTVAALVILVPAAVLFAGAVAMLVMGIFVGAWVDGTIDAPLTHLFFGREEDENRAEIAHDDYIGMYLELVMAICRSIKRAGGGVRDDTALAQTYGLHKHRSLVRQVTPPATANVSLARPVALSAAFDWPAVRRASVGLQFVFLSVAAMLTLVIPVLLILGTLSFVTQWGNFSEAYGSVTILQVFIAWLAILLTALHRRANLTAVIAIALIGCAWFDLNDTHHIRRLGDARPAPTAASTLAEGFSAWLDSRRDARAGERYPVYVVAARGGGIYAAYHAAIFLSRLQDSCPSFTEHLFAISSVSGGSLGAGVFSALASTTPRPDLAPCGQPTGPDGPWEQRVRKILGHDFLSPAVSAALFSDLMLQAVPACVTDRWSALCLQGRDRAWALEASFERAFDASGLADGSKRNPLVESFYGQWSPDGAPPALLVNTTVVETGSRLVVAPFASFGGTTPSGAARPVDTLLGTASDLDLRLSTAIGLSARFPIISPAGWYLARQSDGALAKLRLVDGGYFDNSGVATALDAIDVMQNVAQQKGRSIAIRLIMLTGTASPGEASYWFSEVLSAARTLLATREEHGRRIEELAYARVTDGAAPVAVSVLSAVLDTGRYRLPLGWQLSKASRKAIEDNAGVLTNDASCGPEPPQGGRRTPLEVSSCTMDVVRRDLVSSAGPK